MKYGIWATLCVAMVSAGALTHEVKAAEKAGNMTYSSAAKSLNDAVLIGNGTAGAALYGTFPDEKIDIDEIVQPAEGTVTPEGDAQERYRNMFRPLARLTVRHSLPLSSKQTGYERGLDLSTGTAYTNVTLTEGLRRQEAYASGPDSVIVINYTADVPLNCTISLDSDFAEEITSFDDRIVMRGTMGRPSDGKRHRVVRNNRAVKRDSTALAADTAGVHFITMLKVLPGEGNITTNPDASLTLNHMQGAMLIITTVKESAALRSIALPDDADPVADLARLRVFRASLKGYEGFEKFRSNDLDIQLAAASGEASPEAVSADAQLIEKYAKYLDMATTNPGTGGDSEVFVASPGRIEFVPGTQLGWGDGEVDSATVLGCFNISCKWEKGKITGGNITYQPAGGDPVDTEVELILNGESHRTSLRAWRPVPLENFVDLVRPFIQ